MEGTIWQIYPRQEKGMIRGDDGYEILFRKPTLHGIEFWSLFQGCESFIRYRTAGLAKRPWPYTRC